jgi:hypothetical protein
MTIMSMKPSHGALVQDGDNDYTLAGSHSSVWLTVGDVSIYVRRFEDSVTVELLPHGDEVDGRVLGSCSASLEAGLPEES